jgi:hypothetical protein
VRIDCPTISKQPARTPVEILHASRSAKRSVSTFSVAPLCASPYHQQSDQSCINLSDAERQHLSRSQIQNSNITGADQSDMPWSDGTAQNATTFRMSAGTSTKVRMAIANPDTYTRPLMSMVARAMSGAQKNALLRRKPHVIARHALRPSRTVRPTTTRIRAERRFLTAIQTRSR